MIVDFFFPKHTEDGELKAYDVEGKTTPPLSEASYEPFFYRASSSPRVLYLITSDSAGSEIQRAALVVSGSTGKLSLVDQTVRVQPAFETKDDKPAATEEAE